MAADRRLASIHCRGGEGGRAGSRTEGWNPDQESRRIIQLVPAGYSHPSLLPAPHPVMFLQAVAWRGVAWRGVARRGWWKRGYTTLKPPRPSAPLLLALPRSRSDPLSCSLVEVEGEGEGRGKGRRGKGRRDKATDRTTSSAAFEGIRNRKPQKKRRAGRVEEEIVNASRRGRGRGRESGIRRGARLGTASKWETCYGPGEIVLSAHRRRTQ